MGGEERRGQWERWSTVTVLALCLVAAALGAGLAKQRAEAPVAPGPLLRLEE